MRTTRRAPRLAFPLVVTALVAGAMAPASAGDARSGIEDPDLAAAYAALGQAVEDADGLSRGERRPLGNYVRQSERHASEGAVCDALERLDHFAMRSQEMRAERGTGEPYDVLLVRSWEVRDLLDDHVGPDDGCAAAEDRPEQEPVTLLASSDTRQVAGEVVLPRPRLTTVEGAGRTWTDVHVPGLVTESGEGQPLLPTVELLVAVPAGAGVPEVTVEPRIGHRLLVDLAPAQPGARDAAVEEPAPDEQFEDPVSPDRFRTPAFMLDEEAYAASEPVLPDVTVAPLGRARDLQLVQVGVPIGNYTPATDELVLYEGFAFHADFGENDGYFLTERSFGPFEPSVADYAGVAINATAVHEYVGEWELDLGTLQCPGGELLILTHPDLRAASDRLAEHKRDRGLTTVVANVADGAGPGPDTADEIDDYIEEQYDGCVVRPSYILLMGDAELIPPSFYTATNWSANTGSDYGYATDSALGLFAFLPLYATGRIPVDTLDQADDVVDKIIDYEASPPGVASFYDDVAIAGYFQCCQEGASAQPGTTERGFIEVAEEVRGELVGEGYDVDRIYTTDTSYTDYTGDATPRRYFDGTLLPWALRAANGFAWDGDTQDVIDAWDEGRFLVFHRDHGSRFGWGDPGFGRGDLDDLDNGDLQPVVFSINCSSGYWDNETSGGDDGASATATYWAEKALRLPDKGAIGVIGDVRDSHSWANNVISLGLFDAVWPDTVAGFGDGTSKRRLGDILNHAKLYILGQMNVGSGIYSFDTSIAGDQLAMYHVLGDPSLAMWTAQPTLLPFASEILVELDGARVRYGVEGAQVTAWQLEEGLMRPIGRAEVSEGEAVVKWFLEPEEGSELMFSASKAGAVGQLLTPREEPEEPRAALVREPSAFQEATVIDFDDAKVAEHVADRYADQGVRFLDDDIRTPVIVGPSNRSDASTSSEPNSLFNDGDDPATSVDAPLEVSFDVPVRRVGSYLGNGDGGTSATITAYDADGAVVGQFTVTGIGDDVSTFLGIDAGAMVIQRYVVDYGHTMLGEELDDLMFE